LEPDIAPALFVPSCLLGDSWIEVACNLALGVCSFGKARGIGRDAPGLVWWHHVGA
jgi:hypothetical protein